MVLHSTYKDTKKYNTSLDKSVFHLTCNVWVHDEERLRWNSTGSYLFCSVAVSVSPLKCSLVMSRHSSGFELVRVCVCMCLFMGERSQCAWCVCPAYFPSRHMFLILWVTLVSVMYQKLSFHDIKCLALLIRETVSILDGSHSVWECERSLAPREKVSSAVYPPSHARLIQTPER